MLENYFRRKYGILHLFGFTQEDRHLFALSLKYTNCIIRSFTLRLFFKIDLFIYSVKMGSYLPCSPSRPSPHSQECWF